MTIYSKGGSLINPRHNAIISPGCLVLQDGAFVRIEKWSRLVHHPRQWNESLGEYKAGWIELREGSQPIPPLSHV